MKYIMKSSLLTLSILFFSMGYAQNTSETLPYHQIPDAPEQYSPGSVAARFIDGLGYRYYWATEGLTKKELDFSPSADARNAIETLEHIYDLSTTILNASLNRPNEKQADAPARTFAETRKQTLLNLLKASQLIRGKNEKELAALTIIFKRGDKEITYPYWNMMNGPIADAIYHVGQIVSFRRSAGNPMNPKVSVFTGKNRS